MNLLYSFLLPTLLVVSLTGQDEPYKPEGKLPEGFSFKKCAEDDIECLESRSSFNKQYAHYKRDVNSTTSISVVSDVDMTISQSKNGKDVHIMIKTNSSK